MKDYETMLSAARKNLEDQNYKKAAENYSQAAQSAEDDKSRAVVLSELSWALYELKKFDEALEAARKIIKLDADYQAKEDVFRIIGFCLLAKNNEPEALKYLQKSADIDRTSKKQQIALYEILKLHFKSRNYKKAAELIKDIEPYFYQNNQEYWLSILFYKGFVYYYQGELKKSETVFEELLENAKDEKRKASALFGLAFITFSAKEYLKTINLCEAVTSSDPRFFDMETLGFLSAASFFYLGRKDVFQDYYKQLIKQFPGGRYRQELDELHSEISN